MCFVFSAIFKEALQDLAALGFQNACGIDETTDKLLPEDIAETVLYVANLPQRAVVEDVTVWGIDKQVNPL